MKNDISLKINDKEFLPKLLRIMLPIAFQNLMLASVAAADALMLGGLQFL